MQLFTVFDIAPQKRLLYFVFKIGFMLMTEAFKQSVEN